MNTTRATAGAAVLGGLFWVVAALLDWGQDANAVLSAVGLVCFLLALGGVGLARAEGTEPVAAPVHGRRAAR